MALSGDEVRRKANISGGHLPRKVATSCAVMIHLLSCAENREDVLVFQNFSTAPLVFPNCLQPSRDAQILYEDCDYRGFFTNVIPEPVGTRSSPWDVPPSTERRDQGHVLRS